MEIFCCSVNRNAYTQVRVGNHTHKHATVGTYIFDFLYFLLRFSPVNSHIQAVRYITRKLVRFTKLAL